MCNSLPVSTSHIFAVLSIDPVATVLPCGSNDRHTISVACPLKVWYGFPFVAFHSWNMYTAEMWLVDVSSWARWANHGRGNRNGFAGKLDWPSQFCRTTLSQFCRHRDCWRRWRKLHFCAPRVSKVHLRWQSSTPCMYDHNCLWWTWRKMRKHAQKLDIATRSFFLCLSKRTCLRICWKHNSSVVKCAREGFCRGKNLPCHWLLVSR